MGSFLIDAIMPFIVDATLWFARVAFWVGVAYGTAAGWGVLDGNWGPVKIITGILKWCAGIGIAAAIVLSNFVGSFF